MSTSSASEGFRFEGKHMLIIMVSFFGIIAAVNVSMAVLANSNWTGLVVKNSYVASQEYNSKLDDASYIRNSGLLSDIGYQKGELRFVLKGTDGRALEVTELVAKIGRPAHEHEDQMLKFKLNSDLTYVLPVELAQGTWSVSITGIAEGIHYRRDERIFVNSSGEGAIE